MVGILPLTGKSTAHKLYSHGVGDPPLLPELGPQSQSKDLPGLHPEAVSPSSQLDLKQLPWATFNCGQSTLQSLRKQFLLFLQSWAVLVLIQDDLKKQRFAQLQATVSNHTSLVYEL